MVAFAVGPWVSAHAGPGDHIRSGDAVIIPSVMTGIEAHSNLYLADGGGQSPEVSAMAWVLRPRVQVDLNARTVAFNLGAGYGLKTFIDFYPDDDFHPENADRFADLDADMALVLFPQSKVGVKLNDRFQNEALAAELPTSEGVGTANVIHSGNDFSGGVVLRPGSALAFDVLGQFGVDSYAIPLELTTEDNASFNGRTQYGPIVNGTWKFLPKTSMIANFSYNFLRWDSNLIEALGPDVEGSSIGSYIGKPDADAWRLNAGVTGQFTQKLAASAQIGFGQMIYDEQSVLDDPKADGLGVSSNELNQVGDETFATDTSIGDGVLVNLQVSYAPRRGHTLSAGYRKDFQDVMFSNFVAFNHVFLRYEATIQNRVGVGGELSYRLDSFHGEVARSDQNLLAKVNASYKLTPYLSAGASGSWARRACASKDCDGTFYSTQYDDFSGTLGATFAY